MSVREGSVWPKLLASFAGGIVCMSLLPEIGGTVPAKAPDARASLARESVPAAVEPEKPVVAEAPPPAPERPDSKPIRVITTDRVAGAPSPVLAATPDKPRAGKPAPRKPAGGDATSLPQESVDEAMSPPSVTTPPPAAATTASTTSAPQTSSAAAAPTLVQPPVPAPPSQPSAATETPSGTASVKPGPNAEGAPAASNDAKANADPEPAPAAAASAQPSADAPPVPVAASPAPKAKPRARVRTADAERRARAQRRLAEQEELVDGQGNRLRTLRLLDGRLVTVRVPQPETRGRRYYDEADLPPPPPYARYRRSHPDSSMSWLDPPGY